MSVPALVPADLRARLRDLRLALRSHAGGDGLGQHSSRSRGAGLEFAQYRAYEPGDEPRRIDWKLYARSDRYFVREAERDSPLTAWIVLDATASMRQADSANRARSKLDAAKTLAACVIELALRQGDRFGLVALGGDAPRVVPAGAGPRHRDRCVLELLQCRPGGAWPGESAVRPLWERIAPSSLVVLLSDFFDDATVALAERLASARREVASVQIVGADERDFPFRGSHRFVDPESPAERRVDAGRVRADFLQRFGAARAQLARRFAALGIRHAGYVLDQPADAPLRALFGAPSVDRGFAATQPQPSDASASTDSRAAAADRSPQDAHR
ncbi:MAG TPA: DUF58 domain-containing protein [Dokdonella sp.]|nr:DUF58 domain-containing protein [Dokdonella sp.]